MSSPSHKNTVKPEYLLPLYKNENNDAPQNKPSDANTGLWFERFFDHYAWQEPEKKAVPTKVNQKCLKIADGEKLKWLQKFNSAGDTEALRHAACRQMALVKQLNGKHKFFNTQWHFVTGTGYPHPVENGLLWHPVHGVPYLSGAAVKGLVRAWIEQWAEFATEEERKQRLLSWFGSENKQSTANQAGDIIFFDALPVKEVQLVTDIMTPHYGKWYSEGGNIKDVAKEPEKVPADWHDPIPIPFLVVNKDTGYLFSVAPRNALAAERVKMDEVIDCLTQALEWLGAGAKTATGYGGFNPIEKKFADMEEGQLIDAFSRDYNSTKADFQENEWQQVVKFMWKERKELIDKWANSENKNTKKALNKLKADKEKLCPPTLSTAI